MRRVGSSSQNERSEYSHPLPRESVDIAFNPDMDMESAATNTNTSSASPIRPPSILQPRNHSLPGDLASRGEQPSVSINNSILVSPDSNSTGGMFGLLTPRFLATPMVGSSNYFSQHIKEELKQLGAALVTAFLIVRAEGINREYTGRYKTHSDGLNSAEGVAPSESLCSAGSVGAPSYFSSGQLHHLYRARRGTGVAGEMMPLGSKFSSDQGHDEDDTHMGDLKALGAGDDRYEETMDFSTFIPFQEPNENSSAETQAPPSPRNPGQLGSAALEFSGSDMFCPLGVMSASADQGAGFLSLRSSSKSPYNGADQSRQWYFDNTVRSQSHSVGNDRLQEEQLVHTKNGSSFLTFSLRSPGRPMFDALASTSDDKTQNFAAPFLGRRVVSRQLLIPVPQSFAVEPRERSDSVNTTLSSSHASHTSWPFMDSTRIRLSRKNRGSLSQVPPVPKTVSHPVAPPVEFHDALGVCWTRTEAVVGSGGYSTVYKGTYNPPKINPLSPRGKVHETSPKRTVAIKAIWLGHLTPAQVVSTCHGEVLSMIVLSRLGNRSNRSSRSSVGLQGNLSLATENSLEETRSPGGVKSPFNVDMGSFSMVSWRNLSTNSGNSWSPYLLPLLGFSLCPDSGYLLLVHPLLEGRSLASLLASFGELPLAWIKLLIKNVLGGLITLHSSGITHRDVKPQNIFLRQGAQQRLEKYASPPFRLGDPHQSDPHASDAPNPLGGGDLSHGQAEEDASFCMLGDFGSALVDFKHIRGSTSTRRSSHSTVDALGESVVEEGPTNDAFQGTPPYMAPEACRGQANAASDIWSVGIVLFQLATGRLPWRPTELAHPVLILEQHGRASEFGPEWEQEFPSTELEEVADSVSSVLHCCLNPDPLKRWSATRLANEHPFFTASPELAAHINPSRSAHATLE